MYADFNYYLTEYMGDVLESADFVKYSKKAAKRIDNLTTGKLRFAFPFDEHAANAVKDCECELADFLFQLDRYARAAMDSVGTITQADGSVRGKVVTSVTSGSESVGYSASAAVNTELMEAAKDSKIADSIINRIITENLSYMADANGINLLYRGIFYPCPVKVINPPPEYPKEELPPEPIEPETPPTDNAQGETNA